MKYRFIRFPGGKCKAMTLSYDDGNINDIRLVEIMNRYGLKGTFNLPGTSFPETMENGWHISAEVARTLYFPAGHDVAIHGATHMAPALAAPKDAIRDVLDCRSFLEKFYGRIIRGMAYPDLGTITAEMKTYLKLIGITYARGLTLTHSFSLPTDWLEWIPTTRNRDPKLMETLEKFLAADPRAEYISHRESLLFYMWGHSFEFQPDNWHIMEDFGARASGHDDIWYANNTEIYEYCHAYDQLVFSCDNTMVYNPTQTRIWFDADGERYEIAPGGTLTLP